MTPLTGVGGRVRASFDLSLSQKAMGSILPLKPKEGLNGAPRDFGPEVIPTLRKRSEGWGTRVLQPMSPRRDMGHPCVVVVGKMKPRVPRLALRARSE